MAQMTFELQCTGPYLSELADISFVSSPHQRQLVRVGGGVPRSPVADDDEVGVLIGVIEHRGNHTSLAIGTNDFIPLIECDKPVGVVCTNR